MRNLVRSGLEQATLRASAGAQWSTTTIMKRATCRAGRPMRRTTQHDLRGEVGEVRHFADHAIAERGVRHGKLVLVPVSEQTETQSHHDIRVGPHRHLHVKKA